MINLISMIAVGIPRHFNKKFDDDPWVAGFYFFFAAGWLVMWAVGLHLRFQEAGRAVCSDDEYCDPAAEIDANNADPCEPTMLYSEEYALIQKKSCSFMKYYLDIAGLLIGGYAAWLILGLTGATKTPVWTPKSSSDKSPANVSSLSSGSNNNNASGSEKENKTQ